jgi:hypothetical protein
MKTETFEKILRRHGSNDHIPEYWYTIIKGKVMEQRNRAGSREFDIQEEFGPYEINPEINMASVGLDCGIGMFL